jgi:hypothetical protein
VTDDITPDPLAELQRIITDESETVLIEQSTKLFKMLDLLAAEFATDIGQIVERLENATSSHTYNPELEQHHARTLLEQYLKSWDFWLSHLPLFPRRREHNDGA